MTATAERHKVLVIDDSFMVRKSLVDQLSSQRFEVFEASDGPSGLNEASRINPDVILLDYVMPGMNGFEVYQALRQQPQFANTPVIVISSSREEVIKKFGQPFIGFDFLPKAFTREQLEERIDAVLPMRQTGIKPQPVNFQEIHTALVMGMEELQGRLVQELNGLRSSGPDRTGEVLDRLNALEAILKPTDRTNDILDRLNA